MGKPYVVDQGAHLVKARFDSTDDTVQGRGPLVSEDQADAVDIDPGGGNVFLMLSSGE